MAYGAEHYETAVERSNYAVALALSGKQQEGEAELLHAMASQEKMPAPDFEILANFYQKFAQLKIAQGEAALALRWIDRIDQLPANPATPATLDLPWESELGTLRTAALVCAERWLEARAQGIATDAIVRRDRNPDAAVRVEVSLLRAVVSSHLDDAATTQQLTRVAVAELAVLPHPPARFLGLAQALKPQMQDSTPSFQLQRR